MGVSGAADQAPLSLPRKLSLSNMQGGLASPRDGALPSPRVRPGFDGVLSDTWSARRRTSENVPKVGVGANKSDREGDGDGRDSEIKEEEEDMHDHTRETSGGTTSTGGGSTSVSEDASKVVDQTSQPNGGTSIPRLGNDQATQDAPSKALPSQGNLAEVEWSYLDPQGQVQGGYSASCSYTAPHEAATSRAVQGGINATLVQ